MKHTKGKWIIYETACQGDSETLIGCNDPEIYPLATVNDMIEEGQANAKLISKAPEMYEALKDIIDRYPNSPWIIDKLQSLLKEIEE